MANVDRPFGLIPVQHLDGSPFNGKVTMYLFEASDAVYIGDPVITTGDAGDAGVFVNGVNCEGMATANRAAAGGAIRGVVVAFLPLQSDLTVLHKKADATKRIGLVVDSPDVVFEIQEDSAGGAITAGQTGNNFDMITYATGNDITGYSIIELDSSDSSGTAAATYRTLGLVKRPDNAFGVNAKWLVAINEHELKSTTGT